MPQPTIDREKCVKCGQCVAVCPSMIYRKTKDGVEVNPEAADLCFPCGQCMAVCPTEAVTAPGLDYGAFGELPAEAPDAEALERLLVTRRTVRRYRDEPVSREDLEHILRMAATAPMGVPPQVAEVVVLSRREQIEAILPAVFDAYEDLFKQARNAIARFFIRRAIGPEGFDALEEHLFPFVVPMCKLYREQGIDCATWGAPAMLLFHATRRSVSGKENCLIACTYAMLAAHAQGLGSAMIGLVPPVIERNQELRAKLGIREGNECVISLILGHPAPHYRRTVPREFRTVSWVE